MKYLALYFVLITLISCSKKQQVIGKLYNQDFYSSIIDYRDLKNDSSLSKTVYHINRARQRLLQDYKEGKATNAMVAFRLIIEYEYGGEITHCINEIASQDSLFQSKYNLSFDPEDYTIDQALLYLTNMERDVFALYIKKQSKK